MKLNAKVGLIVTATVLVAGVGTLYVIWQLLVKNVRAEIEGNAQTVMDAALAVRAYTVDSKHGIRAVLHNDADDFYPQTVPAYAARQVTDRLRKTQQVSYREAMANPHQSGEPLGRARCRTLPCVSGKSRYDTFYGYMDDRRKTVQVFGDADHRQESGLSVVPRRPEKRSARHAQDLWRP